VTSGPPALPERETGRGQQHGGKARSAVKMPNALPCKARVIRRKARLPKSQSPGVEWRTPPGTASDAGAAGMGRFRVSSPEPSRPADDGQRACSRGQKGRLSHARYVQRKGNSGWPKGREPYGHGGSVVVVRVTPHRGGRESRPQGEGTQVLRSETTVRYARCETPQPYLRSLVIAEGEDCRWNVFTGACSTPGLLT
jgi:hypothetical protein